MLIEDPEVPEELDSKGDLDLIHQSTELIQPDPTSSIINMFRNHPTYFISIEYLFKHYVFATEMQRPSFSN